ncbi:MAG: hypothetical protein ACREYF_12355, partial [Gammaproteobacteria bacterium]
MSILYVYASPGDAPAVSICRLWRFFISLLSLGRLLAPKAICPLLLALGLGIGVTVQGAVPDALRPVVIGAVQRDAGPSYWVQGAQARNAAQGWRLDFAPSAVAIAATGGKEPWTLKLGLARLGSKQALRAYPVVKRTVSGNRVSYDRRLIEEWYVNGPLGLEQGFTLKQAVGKELILELVLSWPAHAEGSGVRLIQGNKTLYYGALHAVDAKGKVLPSRMRVMDGRVRLEVAAQEAVYPVTIDPLLTEAKLLASDGVTGDDFGSKVALSGDGKTALIGAPVAGQAGTPECDFANSASCGAVYFFVRKAGVWVEQQKITGGSSTIDYGEGLGSSVALSADGKTALIGAPFARGCFGDPNGAAHVYERTGNVWVQRGFLSIFDCRGSERTFASVALSADGKVALLGRPAFDEDDPGHAYIFVRNAKGKWVPEPPFTFDDNGFDVGSPIFPSGGEPEFGGVVALNGDGNLMLIGGNHPVTGSGPVYVFKRAGAKWKELQKITPPAGVEFEQIALAADGKKALIGAPSSLQAYVFVRGVNFRLQQILSGPAFNRFGASVSITADGQRLLVGAPGAADVSAAYVFRKSGGIWALR